jgi:hypothetical protein
METTSPTPLYRPLHPAESSIRTVTLLSGFPDDDIRCVLAPVTEDSRMPYEALSYAWGDANEKRLITINDHNFYVTENLYQALLHLRLSGQDRIL